MAHEIQVQTIITNIPLVQPTSSAAPQTKAPGLPSQAKNIMEASSSSDKLSQEVILLDNKSKKKIKSKSNKLTLIPLIFLIYFEVCGGPYGAEPAVQAAGPLLALLGFLFFPIIWSIPEALITAELSTALPGNGGFVLWANAAFGTFAGSLMGTWKFLSAVINNASYPVLCVDYLARVIPSLQNTGAPRNTTIVAFAVSLSFLNYTGLNIVGYTAMLLGVISLLPFAVLSIIAIPKIQPRRWVIVGSGHNDWRLYINILFWNLNFWDNVSTVAGEVAQPQRTFPRALLAAVVVICVSYIVPLLASIGALAIPQDQWGQGFFAEAADIIGGKWLKYWIEVGAVLSSMGMYEAQLSSGAYQLLGMADLGILPKFFGTRCKWFNTPWLSILLSSLMTLGIAFMSLNDIISSANFLYSLGMLLEYSSFLWLRKKLPNLKRPYKVPVKLPSLICMCLGPITILVYVMVIATWKVWVISSGMTIFGIMMYYLLEICKAKSYMKFTNKEDAPEEEEDDGTTDMA